MPFEIGIGDEPGEAHTFRARWAAVSEAATVAALWPGVHDENEQEAGTVRAAWHRQLLFDFATRVPRTIPRYTPLDLPKVRDIAGAVSGPASELRSLLIDLVVGEHRLLVRSAVRERTATHVTVTGYLGGQWVRVRVCSASLPMPAELMDQ